MSSDPGLPWYLLLLWTSSYIMDIPTPLSILKKRLVTPFS